MDFWRTSIRSSLGLRAHLFKEHHHVIVILSARAGQPTGADIYIFSAKLMWRFLIRFLSAIAVLKIGLASIQYSVHKKLPEAKHPTNNWQPRLPANLPQPPVESRNPIGIVPVPSLSVRSVVTKNLPNSWSANCPSNVWSVRSLKISRLTCVSSPAPSWLSKNPLRLTWLVFSKIPTCAPSTPSVSPLCPRTSNWPGVSVVNVPKKLDLYLALLDMFS